MRIRFEVACLALAMLAAAPAHAVVSSIASGTTLTVTSDDAGDSVAVACSGGNVTVNGAAPNSGPIACIAILQINVTALPTLNIPQGLDYLERYPYGCVEQTTSACFPLVYLSELGRYLGPDTFQRDRVASMQVKAGEDGVLQELPLELGQWVVPGQVLARVAQPGRLKAVLRVPETQAKDVTSGQKVSVDTRNGIVEGRVMRIDPAAQNGTVTVEVALEGELPRGARAELSVDGTIEIERLDNVKHVGRPAYGQAESVVGLFRLEPDGETATRVNVKLGRASVNSIEVLQGLEPGDMVIISDVSQWDSHNRLRLK